VDLTKEELEFIHEHADDIKMMAKELWSGSIPIDEREVYQTVFLKAGGRQAICWTCGGSIKQLGKRLQQWL